MAKKEIKKEQTEENKEPVKKEKKTVVRKNAAKANDAEVKEIKTVEAKAAPKAKTERKAKAETKAKAEPKAKTPRKTKKASEPKGEQPAAKENETAENSLSKEFEGLTEYTADYVAGPIPDRKKVLIVASEATPFSSSGGLGDVIGSLPGALRKQYGDKIDVRVIVPLHSCIKDELRSRLKTIAVTSVPLSWRRQYCGVLQTEYEGVIYYFIDNEYYFKRKALYGEYDDGERYAFFCKAVLEVLPVIDFYPDIVHANDWEAALTVIYLKRRYGLMDHYRDIKTVFTIHNIAYQGVFGFEILGDVFDLSPFDREIVEYSGAVNLMKGAIICAEKVTTVSPTYAKEILCSKFSSGLHHVLEMYKGKLSGILNGIDYDFYDPAKDPALFANYDVTTIDKKKENKIRFQEMVNLPVNGDIPMIAVISRLVAHKGLDLITIMAEDLLAQNVQLVIIGQGDYHYESYFYSLMERYPGKVYTKLAYNRDLANKLYAAADIFVMPSRSEPCGLSQMIASRYGTVPVVRETGGLYDTIRDIGWLDGSGNGFTFAPYSAMELHNALNRAIGCFYNKPEWEKLVKKVMNSDFSWNAAAEKYYELYRSLF